MREPPLLRVMMIMMMMTMMMMMMTMMMMMMMTMMTIITMMRMMREPQIDRSSTVSSPFKREELHEPVYLYLHMTDSGQ